MKRSLAEMGDCDIDILHHAAVANAAPLASEIRARMAWRLNFRLSMAEAW